MVKSKKNLSKEMMKEPRSITHITVGGYKSIGQEQTIEIRPLTILAGVNSSGKSSIMQPLLLLKQTLEAPYDPGPLLLNGPNVKFTSIEQMLTRTGRSLSSSAIIMGLETDQRIGFRIHFQRDVTKGLFISDVNYRTGSKSWIQLQSDMSSRDLGNQPWFRNNIQHFPDPSSWRGNLTRERCFLNVEFSQISRDGTISKPMTMGLVRSEFPTLLRNVIHLPGLRGNPERAYPLTPIGSSFPGTFENYAASAIAQWAGKNGNDKFSQLGEDLKELGLAWKVEAKAINDAQVELKVGRLPQPIRGGAHDLVNIVDVGFGVSQTIPVVVALLAAEPGQLVYIEQPEIHLHPRAQVAMARILANAALRGVQVVAETHSSLLLLGVQSLVADGRLAPDKVKLHWFRRNDVTGNTEVTSADLDEAGRFGEWPEDFDDVSLQAQKHYLDVAEKHLFAK